MKKINKITALFTVLVLIISLVTACSRGNESKEDKTVSTQKESTSVTAKADSVKTTDDKEATETTKESDKEATPNPNKNVMRDMTTMDLVKDMGIGWNLGNTLDAWIPKTKIMDPKYYETSWQSPMITKKMIDGVRDAGFHSVRIPVAWSNFMAKDYTINPVLMNRVEEVTNYALDDDMYVVINIHYDNGWFKGFFTGDYENCMKKYQSIWKQIGSRFAKYGDHLIFESYNEEGVYKEVWDPYGNDTKAKEKVYDILNKINQSFVDVIRAAGGNNEKRHLLISGCATDIKWTCDPLFKMPNDPEKRCAVSVHYYTPSTFTILDKDADWGKAQPTWGTKQDVAELRSNMDMMKTHFIDKGIPVILGEYGVNKKNKTTDMVRLYLTSVCKEAYDRGICPMIWDIPGQYYDRLTCTFYDPLLPKQLGEVLKK
ncbi:glycoside hydrolase family 5 protein [Anaeromicropila herbilytica]|uniref:Endoglucanase n=1 Tax=Anaeromicropila herbilytica TaxID=2785025 RepID=A0A7R7ICI9_9FIRM|nr:glycoside hydrolase family 5 protein [Anaeromicropila herbilytica]BCN30798.1 endoglucanase [Anaeromicropila herbilytica]